MSPEPDRTAAAGRRGAALLALGGGASLWLAAAIGRRAHASLLRIAGATLVTALPVGLIAGIWRLVFFVW